MRVCEPRVLAWAAALMGSTIVSALDNGRALTPPQGWTAWNSLVFHPTQSAVEAAMRALAKPRDTASGRAVDGSHATAFSAVGSGVSQDRYIIDALHVLILLMYTVSPSGLLCQVQEAHHTHVCECECE